VLKWYWWRFNGYGYFWGMVSGIAASMIVPLAPARCQSFERVPADPGDFDRRLPAGNAVDQARRRRGAEGFYRRVRPWGFWGPVLAKVQAEDPSFQPNPDFVRDMFNVVVGIAWQTSLIALPIYVVIRRYDIRGDRAGGGRGDLRRLEVRLVRPPDGYVHRKNSGTGAGGPRRAVVPVEGEL
jgi:SSS family solute:Na+ symporter